MTSSVPPSAKGSGAGPATCTEDARSTPYSDAMLRGASALPPVGSAALTKPAEVAFAPPTWKFLGRDGPLPLDGVNAVIAARPTAVRSPAGTTADRCVESTY